MHSIKKMNLLKLKSKSRRVIKMMNRTIWLYLNLISVAIIAIPIIPFAPSTTIWGIILLLDTVYGVVTFMILEGTEHKNKE